MEINGKRVSAGTIEFAIQHRDLDGGLPGHATADQGVTIQVVAQVKNKETEVLRFDCFDQAPHYHYGPENKNEMMQMDKTTSGSPIGWTIGQLRDKLPAMLTRAGYEKLAGQIDPVQLGPKLDEVESIAREMAVKERNTVTHNRGTVVIEAGAVRFGLEYRHLARDRGQAIHVLGDVSGQEIELLAFDCFVNEPHYHYGPRNQNLRIFWDKTVVPDTLRWTLDQFKAGKLGPMIQRAGYPGIVAEMDQGLIQSKLPQVESQALAMVEANTAKE